MKAAHPGHSDRLAGGLTLVEVVLALGVLAVILPLVMLALAAGLEAVRDAGRQTRASLLVRRTQVELAAYRADGPGMFATGGARVDPPRVAGADGVPLWLGFGAAGEFIRTLDPAEAANGVRDPAVRHVVCLAGVAAEPGVARWQLRVEAPAAAAAPHRSRSGFVLLGRIPEVRHAN